MPADLHRPHMGQVLSITYPKPNPLKKEKEPTHSTRNHVTPQKCKPTLSKKTKQLRETDPCFFRTTPLPASNPNKNPKEKSGMWNFENGNGEF